MGVVFRAKQISLNRPVALKMILSGQLASAADVQRFRIEAEAAANLDHPNILPIYEVGEHEGQQYFSMKLIEGCASPTPSHDNSLSREASRRAAGEGRSGRSLRPPARHLAPRPQAGEHSDRSRRDTPYVTDFGLAKQSRRRQRSDAHRRHPRHALYMAPEQARAEKQLTTGVDVYALGAILYELLTSAPPFRAATALDTILQVLDQEPANPRHVNPLADRDLSVIALKCLEKNPSKRYGSAEALAEDLDRWLHGEPIRRGRPTYWNG